MKIFISTIFIFTSCLYFAQSPTEWTTYFEKDGVTISYKYADCDLEMGYDEQRVLLKIDNNSGKKAHIIWNAHQYYNNKCLTCEDPWGEYRREFSLEPTISLEGICSIKGDNRLIIFSKWVSQPNKTELTKFELNDINITTYDK